MGLCCRSITPCLSSAGIAFYHTTEYNYVSTGWYVDDIEIVKSVPAFSGDFESGWNGWSADAGVWEVGIPTAGPSSAHGGSQCAGTILGGDYPGYTDSRLISPSVNLPAVSGDEEIHLRFWQWFSYASYSSGQIQVSVYSSGVWGAWEDMGVSIVSSNPVWSLCDRDLTSYAGSKVRIAFYHTTEYNYVSTGWYVDDVGIYGPRLAVTTIPATSVTLTSATLNGHLSDLGGSSSVQVSFEWGLTTGYGGATTPQTMTGAGAFSANISGLTQGRTYHFRAKAVGDGTAYGTDMTFVTTGAYPRWDINQDGKVDYKDLAILGAHYGETTAPPYPAWDINRDGKVDYKDLAILGAHYGEVY